MRRPDSVQLTSQIREESLRLGFSRIGIAPAGPVSHGEYFSAWLEKGFHGDMRYLERETPKRRDPRNVLPGARSVLVLALSYYTGETGADDAPMKGRISRYARGADYHSIVVRRLEILRDYIRRLEPSAQAICYADTGPVMEKAWGARTAMGWLGKNSSLIARDCGSWFFIGVMLLNIALEYDRKSDDSCGSCRRCIEACPTGALVAPYVLDARLCISYLTIELRGPIPRPLRPLMGNRIFGCDACQDVCPWNRFAVQTPEPLFRSKEGLDLPDLSPLVRISPEEFKQRYKSSAIWRATRDGFVRNVAVALGNSGRSEAVPALEEALRDASPLVRAHAAWALGRLADDCASRILESAQSREESPEVLGEITLALRKP